MAARHAKGLAGEVAEASRTRTGKLVRAYPRELVATARTIEKLMAQRRKLNKSLRDINARIKHEKKMLKALAGAEVRDEL